MPKILIGNSIPILFTDDTSDVTTNSNFVDFQPNIKAVFEQLNKWFNLNLLSLNFDKTNFIHFKTKYACNLDTVIENDNRLISNIFHTNFLGMTLDNTLYWKAHIDQLLPKLSSACYAINVFKQIMPQETLVMVDYAIFTQL